MTETDGFGIDGFDRTVERLKRDLAAREAELAQKNAALEKINAIRNSIIGFQNVNWSEHIYPLVAALNESGCKGQSYPEARENAGTLVEQINLAERERDEAREELARVREELARSQRIHKEDFDKLTGYVREYPIALQRAKKAEADLDAARKALAIYGRHHDSCGDADAYNGENIVKTCSCGLDAAIGRKP